MYSLPGTEVPSATNTTAVTESFRPMVQPKWEARSPMKAVSRPIMRMETMKHAQPFQYSVGGDKGEEDLPEHSQKVHHVVKTGGQLLLPTFVVIVIFP